MLRAWLLRAAQFAASLVGAVLLAAVLPVISRPHHAFWPFLHAYAANVSAIFTGNFGASIDGVSALSLAAAQWPASFELIGLGFAIALLIGLPVGLLLSGNRALRAATPLLQIVSSAPVFVVALGLFWIAARLFHGDDAHRALLFSLLLPALTVGVAGAASIQLVLRRKAAASLVAPWRRGLRMMGLGAIEIDLRFVLPEMLAGLLRSLGEIVLTLFAATAIAERVFHRDGAMALFLKSAAASDWAVAACILFGVAALALAADFIGATVADLIVVDEHA